MERLQFLSKEEKARIVELLKRIREISRNFESAIECDLTFNSPVYEVALYGLWMMKLHQDFIAIDSILTRKEGGEV